MGAEGRTNGNYKVNNYAYSIFHCEYTEDNNVTIKTEALMIKMFQIMVFILKSLLCAVYCVTFFNML